MKANELRLGNWVESVYTDHIFKLTSIDEGRVCTDESSLNINHVCGIPLTPEILKKAGFDKQQSTVGMNDSFDYTIGFNHVTCNHLLMLHSNRCGEFFYQNIRHEIKYVHQLQNLYFVLTESELTINL